MKHFFVSYASPDKEWAEWIAWTLEEAGYSTIIQAWDFRPGNNFAMKMHHALQEAEAVIPVLTPNYLISEFSTAEWLSKFVQDPVGEKRMVIPVRVMSCDAAGLLRGTIYIDIVGYDGDRATRLLLDGVKPGRAKPIAPLPFPGLDASSIGIAHKTAATGFQCLIRFKDNLEPTDIDFLNQAQEALRSLTNQPTLKVEAILPETKCVVVSTSIHGFHSIRNAFEGGELKTLGGNRTAGLFKFGQMEETDGMVAQMRRASEALLRWPKTLADGTWIQRDEAGQISDEIATAKYTVKILLGEPGSGKSATLSKLAGELVNDGHAVLGIKADLLPPSVASEADLGRYLGLGDKPAALVLEIAQCRPVIVLVDQLDALADMTDLRTGRLDTVLSFLNRLAGVSNVHLILSCRTFEFHHDVRVRALGGTEIALSPPSWALVEPVLLRAGIDATSWPEKYRELLRSPQHLQIFLSVWHGNEGDAAILDSYQRLLERLWDQRIGKLTESAELFRFMDEFATDLIRDECLWAPVAKYDAHLQEIEILIGAGLLVYADDQRRIGFRHQTLLEYACARAFAKGAISLFDHVIERQDAVLVRPLLWNVLIYLRNVDPSRYKREMQRLWDHRELRLHLRYLLIDFLGQVLNPDEQEQNWLFSFLNVQPYTARILFAVAGQRQWFEPILKLYLPSLMRTEKTPRGLSPFLSRALSFARDEVLAVMREHWLPSPVHAPEALQVLGDLADWNETAVEFVCAIVRRMPIHSHYLMMLAAQASHSVPQLAPRIVAAEFNRRIEEVAKTATPAPSETDEEDDLVKQVVARIHRNNQDPYRRLLEAHQEWYQLGALAEAAPLAFLDEMWPVFLKILNNIASDDIGVTECSYNHTYTAALELDPIYPRHQEYGLVVAIEQAVTELAEQDPASFIEFVRKYETCGLLVVQRLLLRGFVRAAETCSKEALAHLLADERRLNVGGLSNRQSDSMAMISVVVPHLDPEQRSSLESRILAWRLQPHPDGDPETRRHYLLRERQIRAQLLSAFPKDTLSSAGEAYLGQCQRTIPYDDMPDVEHTGFHEIVSPMSSESMAKAKDQDILNLFAELVDETEWDHPRHSRRMDTFFKGGSIQASRAFGEFAKAHPTRAVAIMRRLKPVEHERPVGAGLRALSSGGMSAEQIFSLIREFDAAGFKSANFRHEAAAALDGLAKSPLGLPDDLCELLEGWLPELVKADDAEIPQWEKDSERDRTTSILWHHGPMVTVPQGAYTVMETLTKGYLLRQSPAHDKWLSMLENHLKRGDGVLTWHGASMWILSNLRLCDKQRAASFVLDLSNKYPKVFASLTGSVLITNLQWWLPDIIFWHLLDAMLASDWNNRFQSYAEIVFLRHLLRPDDRKAADEVSKFLDPDFLDGNSDDFRLGLSFASSRLWAQHDFRQASTSVLLALIPKATAEQSEAVMDMFRVDEHLEADEYTRQVIECLCDHPHLLKHGNTDFFLERLQDLLPVNPELVCRACEVVLKELGEQIADPGSSHFMSAEALTNIALTIQRTFIGSSRSKGIELFERLLELNAHDANATLDEIDARPRTVPVRPPRRRYKGKRKS